MPVLRSSFWCSLRINSPSWCFCWSSSTRRFVPESLQGSPRWAYLHNAEFAQLTILLLQNQDAQDRFERNYTLLFLMLLLLPQNGAILLVWSRNLLAGWFAPFPSDHNVLAIAGYLLLVEYGQTGKILRHSELPSFVIYPCAAGVLLYGARYAFIASIAVNLVFLSLYVVQWRAATSP